MTRKRIGQGKKSMAAARGLRAGATVLVSFCDVAMLVFDIIFSIFSYFKDGWFLFVTFLLPHACSVCALTLIPLLKVASYNCGHLVYEPCLWVNSLHK
jgi:hypothetical protein